MSCDDGSVMVCKCDRRQERLVTSQQWPGLHSSKSKRSGTSCTSVCVSQDGSIASAGEDNKICLLSVESTSPLRIIGQCLYQEFVMSLYTNVMSSYINGIHFVQVVLQCVCTSIIG